MFLTLNVNNVEGIKKLYVLSPQVQNTEEHMWKDLRFSKINKGQKLEKVVGG